MTRAASSALLIACALAGCGKKGPPLAPVAHIPAAIDKLTINHVGDDMYVSLTVPTKNIDGTMPADVGRVDVYGLTAARQPSPTQFLQVGSRVASVPVARPPRKGETAEPTNEPEQGGVITIHDGLSAAERQPKELPIAAGRTPSTAPAAPAVPPEAASEEAPVPQRYYMALAFSERGRPGPPGTPAGIALLPAPDPPMRLDYSYTADTLTLRWDSEQSPDAGGTPVAGTRYNVYRRAAPDPLDLPTSAPPPWEARPPAPANPTPLSVPEYTEPTDFDHETCFEVRAVRDVAGTTVEGDPSSPPLCVTPVDSFPPAPPKNLSAVAAEGAISLIWEPNSEPDLDGYLVLRGEAGNATLQPLTAMPIPEAQFTDRTAQSGVRYVYAVVAVDNRVPVPNTSAESNRVEETAR